MITILFNDYIDLVVINKNENDLANYTESETKTTVFANKKSVRQSEFYQAIALGLKPEVVFEIRYSDYNDELFVDYNKKRYSVIRTYSKNNEFIELVCQLKI